jgi:hypothetical protein
MGSGDMFLRGGLYVVYFAYVLVFLAIIYGTVQTISHANEGSTTNDEIKTAIGDYQREVDLANTTSIIQHRFLVFAKSCNAVQWTESLPPFLRLAGLVIDDKHLRADLCEYRPVTQLVYGIITICTSDDKVRLGCLDLTSQEMIRFSAIAPGGNTSQFANDVYGRTNALLGQLKTVLLPFLFGVIGGFLAVFFKPNLETMQIAGPGSETMRYLVRPVLGGVAGLLVGFLFAEGTGLKQSYSLSMLGLLTGYSLEILPMALNAGIVAVRNVLEKNDRRPPKASKPRDADIKAPQTTAP